MDNDALVTQLFVGLLKGITFDCFRTLSVGSIKSWAKLKARFLIRFYEDDIHAYSQRSEIEEK